MNDKHKKTNRAYDDLLKSYFGAPHGRLPMPPGARPAPRSAEAVLNSYYGKTLPRLQHPLRYGQYGSAGHLHGPQHRHHEHHGHHGDHGHYGHHGNHHGHPHKDHASHVVSLSMDDGEILAPAGQGAIEEYVVDRSMSDQDGMEYVVDRSMSDDISDEYVVEHFADDAGMSYGSSVLDGAMPDPQAEFNTDILSPLTPLAPLTPLPTPQAASGNTANASNGANGANQQAANAAPNGATGNASGTSASAPAATPAPASTPVRAQSVASRPDPNPSTATEEDFMADMQSILSGESVFDPVTRKTVNKNDLARGESIPSPSRQERNQERSAQQDIFDRIAQSMQYANAYDLGTVELENRFADFDRVQDLKKTAASAKTVSPAATVSKAASMESSVGTADFLEDLEKVNNSEHAPRAGGDDVAFSMDAATTDLKGDFVSIALQTVFSDAAGIDQYFSGQGAGNFIDWFNSKAANKGPWAKKAIGGGTQANFKAIWDKIPQMFGSAPINLLQFLSLMSIFINEVGGTLGPIAEKVGTKGHPGLAYPFDKIPEIPKVSYNDGGSSWTAFQCFNDADFIKTHGQKAMGDKLANTTDDRWKGHVYPSDVPTDVNPAVTGFIMEADFYKFRGRGMIQTTWRGGYKKLINFIQNYSGTQAEILSRKQAWAGLSLDQAANVSSNDDWDALFMRTDLEIACAGIALHNTGAGNYLNLSGDVNVLNSHDGGSIWNVGRSINGSAYANLFRNRVITLCNLLGNADA